jgi:hypothetical protein
VTLSTVGTTCLYAFMSLSGLYHTLSPPSGTSSPLTSLASCPATYLSQCPLVTSHIQQRQHCRLATPPLRYPPLDYGRSPTIPSMSSPLTSSASCPRRLTPSLPIYHLHLGNSVTASPLRCPSLCRDYCFTNDPIPSIPVGD